MKGDPGYIYVTRCGKEGGGGLENAGGSAYTSRGAKPGKLFYGGSGSTNRPANGCPGGGGGYYGGGGASSTLDHPDGFCGSGGGGSGYVGGVKSSSTFGITAFTSRFTNSGHGIIKITVLSKLPVVSKAKKVYPIQDMNILVMIERTIAF